MPTDFASVSSIKRLASVSSIATPQAPASRNQKRDQICIYEEYSLAS